MASAINGIFRYCYPTTIAAITDGTSNTLLFGERANGLFSTANGDRDNYGWWSDANPGDSQFTSLYPINPFKKVPQVSEEYIDSYVDAASSFHPGGANFAFVDGSVHFLKDSISTWPFNPSTGFPNGVTDNNGVFSMAPGMQMGVYQALTTRAGGEVIRSDGY